MRYRQFPSRFGSALRVIRSVPMISSLSLLSATGPAGCAHNGTRDEAAAHDGSGDHGVSRSHRDTAAMEPSPSASAHGTDEAAPAPSTPSSSNTPASAGTSDMDTNANPPRNTSASEHWLVQLRFDAGKFQVVRVTAVAKPLPRHRGQTRPSGWRYESHAGTDHVTYSDYIQPPHKIRGEFLGGTVQHAHVDRQGPVDFVVRVPAHSSDVQLFEVDANGRGATSLGKIQLPAEATNESAGAR